MCVDDKKLNATTISHVFPLPFIDLVLDDVTRHEMHSLLDEFLGNNQIPMVEEDIEKTTFITKWVAFVYIVMRFG